MTCHLERTQPTCIAGSGAAKVSSRGEDTPNARRAFADPRAYVSWFARSSPQLACVHSRMRIPAERWAAEYPVAIQ